MTMHGFDEGKLHRNLDKLLGGWIENGALPCVQALVFRHGETAYNRHFGWANMEEKSPLQEDSIFRIYSMTKVFTSVAALMLHEEGRFKMHDPLSKFIPEFAHVKVAEVDATNRVELVAPRREIVIRDLFTMASGIPYWGENTVSERAMRQLMMRGKLWSASQFAKEVAIKVPLTFHPGEHWWYGMSIDLLGALVEVISGQTLGGFMGERIFGPLNLRDTGFRLPPDKAHRLATMYAVDAKGAFKPAGNDLTRTMEEFAFEAGGGGLMSTQRDVGRFARMLLGEGALEGKRLLSRKSVELMRTNHLSEQQLKDYNWDNQRGYGYGLGVRVMMRPEIAGYGSVGEFAWDGLAGTWFAVDPAEGMILVLLIQTDPGRHYDFVPLFAQAVYGAMDD